MKDIWAINTGRNLFYIEYVDHEYRNKVFSINLPINYGNIYTFLSAFDMKKSDDTGCDSSLNLYSVIKDLYRLECWWFDRRDSGYFYVDLYKNNNVIQQQKFPKQMDRLLFKTFSKIIFNIHKNMREGSI